jgi:hypothetical protein
LRKFILIVLSVFLLLSFTGIASAIHIPQLPEGETVVVSKGAADLTLGGRILVRGWYFDNVFDKSSAPGSDGLPLDTGSTALYTTNAYLFVDAKITDNLQAFMELETADATEGSQITSGLYKWGSHDAKPDAELFFRQLWIQYTGSGLLGVPAGIKVGHQLLTLGEKQFLNHERFGDDAIIVFVNATKELHLAAAIVKLDEGIDEFGDPVVGGAAWEDNTNDLDAYVILGTYKLDKDNTIGANYTYVNHSDLNLGLSNAGLHANGLLMGALTYAAEADFQFGEIFDSPNDIDFGGWGVMAKLGYKLDPVNLRASFAYGSGDDDAFDDNYDEFFTLVGNDTQSALARFVHYTQIYERSIQTAAFNNPFNSRTTGIANTTYFNLGLDFMPMKDLSLSLDGFYLLATETGAWEDSLGPGASVDDDLGWEIDFKGSYKLTRNLSYFVEAAWFDPGDFYDDTNPGVDTKSVTQVVHGINLTF